MGNFAAYSCRNTDTRSPATDRLTSSSPVWRAPSNPTNVSRTQERSSAATGQPGFQVDRAITSAGAGAVIREAKPVPGSMGSRSGRVNRRTRSAGGVGRISPKPFDRVGSTRVPSQLGGVAPTTGRSDGRGVGWTRREGEGEGDGEDVAVAEGAGESDGGDDAPSACEPQAASTSRPTTEPTAARWLRPGKEVTLLWSRGTQ